PAGTTRPSHWCTDSWTNSRCHSRKRDKRAPPSPARVSPPVTGIPRRPDPQLLPPAYGRRRRELCCVVVDIPLGPAVQDLVQRDAALQPGEVGSQAVVHTFAKS